MKLGRTNEEIQTQIEALTEIKMKPTFRRSTFFGDSNWDAIEAQINVLEERLTDDDVADLEDAGDLTEHTATIARQAASWLYGESEDTPISDWKGLH